MCFYFQTTCSDIFSCRQNQQASRCSICLSRCRLFCLLFLVGFILLFLFWFGVWVCSLFSWDKQQMAWSQEDPKTYFFSCPDSTSVTLAWNNQLLTILDPQNISPITWTWSFVYPLAPWSRLTNYLLFLSAKLTKSYSSELDMPLMECVYTLGPNALLAGRPFGENFTLHSNLPSELYPQFSQIPYWICLSRLQSCFKIKYDYSLTSSFFDDQKTKSNGVGFNAAESSILLLEKQMEEVLGQFETSPCLSDKEDKICKKSGFQIAPTKEETKDNSSVAVTACENLNVQACIFSLSPRSS